MGNKEIELTGFFNDGLRRIDMIMVVSDEKYEEKIEKLKIDFLINIIKIGLEVEIEAGVMKRHENLMFVKVHAPNQTIENYGSYFNVRKYFKKSHNELINPHQYLLYMKVEKDFISSLRNYYPGPFNYSTIERSTIVYHILLSLPFSRHENFIGLQRLIERNIVVDAYALHDGPHFIKPNQYPPKTNARQVLFYYWVGKKYLFIKQPLHLIREYFGEKVGIYFAFFEYFNIALIFATILGVFVSIEALYDIKDDKIIKEACNKSDVESVKTICPLCRDFNTCPFRNLTDYCVKVTVTNFLDNPWTMIYCILISLWAMLFILLWRRNKNYIFWLWEYDQTDTRQAVRSEFETDLNKIKKSKLTGIITDADSIQIRVLRLVLTALSLVVWGLLVLTVTITVIIWKYELSADFNNLSSTWRDYWAVITVTCINVFIMNVLQRLSRIVSHYITKYENHKTYNSFETSLTIKLFGFGFFCNFTLLIFYYFLNVLYTYPSDINRWYLTAGIGMMNCGPESCLDELCVALVVTIIVREYIFNFSALFLNTKSEYSQTENNVPSWEREYLLKPFTEYNLIEKFNDKVLKFTLVGLFGSAFPLTPLLLLISGTCYIRHEAYQLVVGTRRPLLRQPTSQRIWYKIMIAVVYAVPCFNGIIVSKINSLRATGAAAITATINLPEVINSFLLTIFVRPLETVAMTWMTTMLHYSRTGYNSSYFVSSMGKFVTEDYYKVRGSGSPAEAIDSYKGFVPTECLFPGLRFRSKKLDGKYLPIEKFWRIRHDKHRLMLEVEHVALLLMVILHCVIPAYPRDIANAMAVEERIKRRKLIQN